MTFTQKVFLHLMAAAGVGFAGGVEAAGWYLTIATVALTATGFFGDIRE